jgi:hypothetical protein
VNLKLRFSEDNSKEESVFASLTVRDENIFDFKLKFIENLGLIKEKNLIKKSNLPSL